jgi:hypothetical protein
MRTKKREKSSLNQSSRWVGYCLGSAVSISMLAFGTSSAHAFSPEYHLGVETDFSRHEVTPSTFPFVRLGMTAESSESDHLDEYEYKMDAEFKISPTHPKAYTLSSRNLYFGEKDQSYESPLRFSYGRRVIGWSGLDDMWGLGAFEPLDSWDRMRSFTQGLTGIFAYTETQKFNIRFFFSYLFAPELTPNTIIEDNHFAYEHPQSTTTAPQTLKLLNQDIPLGYQLDIPSISKIIFRQSFAFMIETKREIPFYAKFSYGYMPLNYFPISLEAKQNIVLNQTIVKLRPRLLQHHLYDGEVAYRFSNAFSMGLTGLIDEPEKDELTSEDNTTILTTSYSYSPWIQYAFPQFKLILSHLWTRGGLDGDVGDFVDKSGQTSLFSSRILYRNATQLAITHEFGKENPHHPTLVLKGIHEYAIDANWIAADFYYSPETNLTFYVGGDVISAGKTVAPDRGAEFLADMRAIDRIRLGVTYVF